MKANEKQLESKIHFYEDMLLRCSADEYNKIEMFRNELHKMRIQLMKERREGRY